MGKEGSGFSWMDGGFGGGYSRTLKEIIHLLSCIKPQVLVMSLFRASGSPVLSSDQLDSEESL